jgi:hypothetical protein
MNATPQQTQMAFKWLQHATVRVPTAEPSTNLNKWKTFSKHWRRYNECHASTNTNDFQMDAVFANRREEDEIYPLISVEIAKAQRADATYKHLFKRSGYDYTQAA